MTTSSLSADLFDWLQGHCDFVAPRIMPLRADAGLRRYFRVQEGDRCVIAMDASCDQASCAPFVAIADALRARGLMTPEILLSDLTSGYLLLTDFGDHRLLDTVTPATVDRLYGEALSVLLTLQGCHTVKVPPFTADWMIKELDLFAEWFLQRYLSVDLSNKARKMLQTTFGFLAESIAAQPTVFMHRDFHSANLMVLPAGKIGLLDFQDAYIGPVTYDLVSLLRDCYITWPETKVQQWVREWHSHSTLKETVSYDTFSEWFDLMGVQRHLKALMTFSRKYCRDHDANYLQHIPRTLNYLFATLQKYPVFAGMHEFLLSVAGEKCVE